MPEGDSLSPLGGQDELAVDLEYALGVLMPRMALGALARERAQLVAARRLQIRTSGRCPGFAVFERVEHRPGLALGYQLRDTGPPAHHRRHAACERLQHRAAERVEA